MAGDEGHRTTREDPEAPGEEQDREAGAGRLAGNGSGNGGPPTVPAAATIPEVMVDQRWFNTDTNRVARVVAVAPTAKLQVAFRDIEDGRRSYGPLVYMGAGKKWRFLGDGCVATGCPERATSIGITCTLHAVAPDIQAEWLRARLEIQPKKRRPRRPRTPIVREVPSVG